MGNPPNPYMYNIGSWGFSSGRFLVTWNPSPTRNASRMQHIQLSVGRMVLFCYGNCVNRIDQNWSEKGTLTCSTNTNRYSGEVGVSWVCLFKFLVVDKNIRGGTLRLCKLYFSSSFLPVSVALACNNFYKGVCLMGILHFPPFVFI